MASADDMREHYNLRMSELREPIQELEGEIDAFEHFGGGRPTKPFRSLEALEKRLKFSDKHIKHNRDCLDAVQIVIDQLAAKIKVHEDFKYGGTFIRVGSSKDGTRPGNLNEVDYLFVLTEKATDWFRSKVPTEFKVYNEDGEEIVSQHLNESLRDVIDDIFLNDGIDLPKKLTHAGFAHPEYSYIRCNGPATALLFRWKDENPQSKDEHPLSIDITLALSLPKDLADEVMNDVMVKLEAIRRDNPETPFNPDPNSLHLVPKAPDEKVWQISTSKLEADLVEQLHEMAPVKRIIKVEKLMVEDMLQTAEVDRFFGHQPDDADNDPSWHTDILVLLDLYREVMKAEDPEKVKDLRRDIAKLMRYAHVFLPYEKANDFQELAKPTVAFRTYAIKHLTLDQGAQLPGAFRPKSNQNIPRQLLGAVFAKLETLEDATHFFLRTSIPVQSWSAGVLDDKRAALAERARTQARTIKEKSQGKRKPQQQDPFAQRMAPASDAWTFLCGKCRVEAFALADARLAHGKHLVVLDRNFADRTKMDEFKGTKLFEEDKFQKTHDLYCRNCQEDMGIMTKYIGAYLMVPVVKIRSYFLKPATWRPGNRFHRCKKLKDAPFEIRDLSPEEFQTFPRTQ